MSEFPNVGDPTLAVLIDRFSRLEASLGTRLDKMDARFEKIEASQAQTEKIFTKAGGGYLVLLAAAALFSYALGVWEKLGRLWNAL